MKKIFSIIKLAVVAAAVVIATSPAIKPMYWFIGYE